MDQTSPASVTADLLRVPDGRLYYEVRGEGPLVVLVGAPMDARSFTPLADRLAADHTVLTTDPRGINRSVLDDPDQDSTPYMRGDDLSRLIAQLDAGPATVLGSSGGAVSVLALAQAHPGQVSVVIAHEPPLLGMMEDRAELLAQADDVVATHLSGDVVGAWKKFMANANIVLPEGAFEQMFAGERDPQTVADDHYQHAHMFSPTVRWQPDLAALRSSPARILIGLGEWSAGQICERTSRTLAAELGIEPTMFPGGHTGFAEDPEAFEARLRAVLHES
jgi:pimeloyl-ACP methyl ester carboxylesterase